ncbi:hypothetical protein ACWXWU_13395 [Shewanella sp. A14]
MKVILILILVAIALYLYRRTQAVAKQEIDENESSAAPHSSSKDVAQPTVIAEKESVEEPVSLSDDTVEATTAVDVETEPEVTSSDGLHTDATPSPEAPLNDTATVAEASPLEVKSNATEINQSATEEQGQQLHLDNVEGDWASDSFLQQVEAANGATDLQSQHRDLVSVINHCYKMRKQADYCQYGAALQLTYLGLYRSLHQQNTAQKSTDAIKSPAFMQLSTLLNDVGQFDEAINVCQQALEYQLTDGTVTGFEGRIKRIEKAKAKAS